jgi:hypothetical protein
MVTVMMIKYGCWLSPFLNFESRYLKLLIKIQNQRPFDVQKEITRHDEMNGQIFEIDVYVGDHAINVIESISLNPFDGSWISAAENRLGHLLLID